MKQLAGGLLVVVVLVMLAGCQSDKKQAETIRSALEEAAPLEEQFSADQQKLASERNKVQEIYGKVLDLEQADAETIRQLAGKHEVEKERQQLDAAKKKFQHAQNKIAAIQKTVDSIQDGEQQKAAAKLVKLEDSRKAAMDSYFAAYQDQLDTETAFFDHLEQGKFDLKQIDEQVRQINGDSETMRKAAEQFNAYTKQFNDAQQTYFNMAGLD